MHDNTQDNKLWITWPYLEYNRCRGKFSLNTVVEFIDFKLSGTLFHMMDSEWLCLQLHFS